MKKVFVVDDSEMMIKLIKTVFDPYKVDLNVFTSSRECLENLADDIDLFILDHMFKDGDESGLETLKVIRSKNPLSQVIVVSGQEDPHVVNQYFHLKIRSYILKDSDFYSSLEAEIRSFMKM